MNVGKVNSKSTIQKKSKEIMMISPKLVFMKEKGKYSYKPPYEMCIILMRMNQISKLTNRQDIENNYAIIQTYDDENKKP